MNIGKAVGIFLGIASKRYTDNEKGQAIMQVVQMPTHMGIKKDSMICVIWYLLNICYDIPEGARPPKAWDDLVKALDDVREGGQCGLQ